MPSWEVLVLREALLSLRITIIGLMFLIAVSWSLPSRTGDPIWLFVLAFAFYDAVVELLRGSVRRLRGYAWVAVSDLVVAAVLYYLDAAPGGPLFISFYLAVITAAFSVPPRWLLGYVMVVAATVILIAPTLPLWAPTPENYRDLAVRMVILGLVGTGTALLTRRLVSTQESARRIERDADRLRELERVRAEAASSIAHDLRTPLAAARAALGMLEVSAVERLSEEERRLIGLAQRNVGRLGMLIEDLSAFQQLDHGLVRLERRPLDLRDIVRCAHAAMAPLLEEKRQTVVLDLAEPLPVSGDAWRLEHVVVNLLANAHQHTPPGTRVDLVGTVSLGNVVLTIRDTGPGIPPEELEPIFGRFHRLTGSSRGSGLGLPIARRIVELHGGRLWAENGEVGATFCLRLPLRQVERAA